MRTRALWLFTLVLGCGGGVSSPGEDVTSLEIQPANATLTSTGAPVTLDYTVIAHFADGHTAPAPDAILTLDAQGMKLGGFSGAQFSASGQAAGKGGVFATLGDQSASTAVVVNVQLTHLGEGVPGDAATHFPDVAPAGAGAPTVVYPLAGAVMPTSVKAPNIQWEGALGTDDLYRVRVAVGNAVVDTIVGTGSGFTFSSQPAAADWQVLVNSVDAGPATVTVDHWDPVNGAHGADPLPFRLIPADITGVIYYWNLGEGKMEKIDTNGRASAIPNPPARPEDPGIGSRCVACHSVSQNGRYLAGSLWGGGQQGAVFDMSDPLVGTADPAPTLAPVTLSPTPSYTQLFTTFNPDATRLLVNDGTTFNLMDPQTGTSVAATGLPTGRVAHPVWSPDGASIAFVNNTSIGGGANTWAVDYDYGDLQVMSASANDTFGAPTTLVPGTADPSFPAPSWPSFSPDSSTIAYGAGTNSRGANMDAVYPGTLFVIDRAGGTPRRLDIACASQLDCHLPSFSPYDQGGYYWLVFYSFRDYGNAQAGTKGTARRQLWITAIDKTKLANGIIDPSSVPYWLPDQDTQTPNMSAFWALPAPIF